jgi:hypothetical protein
VVLIISLIPQTAIQLGGGERTTDVAPINGTSYEENMGWIAEFT